MADRVPEHANPCAFSAYVHVRIVFFPEDAPRPRFVWVRLKHHTNGTLDTKNLELELTLAGTTLTDHPHDLRVSDKLFFTFDGILRRVVDPIIVVGNLDNNDELHKTTKKPSRSIEAMDKSLSPLFPGPLFFIGYKNRNLDTKDFRHIVDHMSMILYRSYDMVGMNTEDEECVEGVEICCRGDTEVFARSVSEAHAVPRGLLNDKECKVPVSDVLGIPLVMFPLPPSLAWRGRKLRGGDDVMDNAPALDIHPLLTSNFDKGKVGSVLVARVDGKKLHRAHVHAPSKYCSILLRDLSKTKIFEDGAGSNKTPEELRDLRKFQNKHIMQFARKKHFAAYSMTWPTKPEADGDAWEAEQLWTTEEVQEMQQNQDEGSHPSCLNFNEHDKVVLIDLVAGRHKATFREVIESKDDDLGAGVEADICYSAKD